MVISEIPVRYRLFLCVFLLYLPFVYSTTWSENDATLRQTIALVDSGTIQIGKPGQMDSTEKHLIRLSQFRVVGDGVYAKTSAGLSYFLACVFCPEAPVSAESKRTNLPLEFSPRGIRCRAAWGPDHRSVLRYHPDAGVDQIRFSLLIAVPRLCDESFPIFPCAQAAVHRGVSDYPRSLDTARPSS